MDLPGGLCTFRGLTGLWGTSGIADKSGRSNLSLTRRLLTAVTTSDTLHGRIVIILARREIP